MIAFVLSGGGNRGALQVGALQALLEAGLVPDMVVGASVGAINGAYIAWNPTAEGAGELAEIWAHVTRDELYPGNPLTALWSIARGKEGLFGNERWHRFLHRHMPCTSFGHLQRRCYVLAAELATGRPHLFGENPEDCLLDALMASSALPPLHPPYTVNGVAYIDGGAAANLPLRVALQKGATQIYALNIPSGPTEGRVRNLMDVSARAIGTMLQRQLDADLELCAIHRHVWLRQIDLAFPAIEPWDFTQTSALVAAGREAVQQALAQGPLRPPTWQERLVEQRDRLAASLAASTAQLASHFWPKETAKSEVVVHH